VLVSPTIRPTLVVRVFTYRLTRTEQKQNYKKLRAMRASLGIDGRRCVLDVSLVNEALHSANRCDQRQL